MSDDSNQPVDSLEDFEIEFYQQGKPVVDEVVEEAEIEEDSLATEEDETEVAEDEGDAEPDGEEDEPEAEAKPKKKTFQDRINEVTARAYEAERREAQLRAEFEALKAEVKPKEETKPDTRQQLPTGAPTPEDLDDKGEALYPLGEFDPLFIRDLTRFTIRQENEEAQRVSQQEAAAKAAQDMKDEIVESYAQRFSELAEEVPTLHEDVQELTSAFAHVPEDYGEYLAMTIMSMDNGPRLMHYLSQNIGEAQKIVASGPAAATLAIGRLDAILSKPKQEDKRDKIVSKAPTPPEGRSRGTGGKFVVPPDTDNLDAFEKVFFKK